VLTLLNICGGCWSARFNRGCLSSLPGGEAEADDRLPLDSELSEELRGLEQTLLLFVLLVAGWRPPEAILPPDVLPALVSTPESLPNGDSVLRIWWLYLLLRLLTMLFALTPAATAMVTAVEIVPAAIGHWVVVRLPFPFFRLIVTPPLA